jgi:GT2 family glycosyltransferase
VITQKNSGRSVAKNNGAGNAMNELLWFIDDDMRVDENSLTAHVEHHHQNPGTISVGTQLEDEPLMISDIQRYKCYISRGWRKQIESAANPLGVNDLYMTSANVSMSKLTFSRLGGFDERLRDAEDLDLVYRAYLANVAVYYNAKAVGYHLDLITCRSYIIRNRQYMEGYDRLRTLKPEYMKINKRMHISNPSGNKKWLLSVVCQPLFVKLIDHFNIFKYLLPLAVRYRFYEVLIFGLGRVFPSRKI